MRRLTMQILGGAFVSLACLSVAVPAVVVHAEGGRLPVIATGWWLVLFAAFFVAFSVAMWCLDLAPRPVVLSAVAAQSVLAPALVLTAPSGGWTPILLVFTVAVSAYSLSMRAVVALICVNTVVVGAATAMVAERAFEVVMVAGLYLMLQSASVFGVIAHLRDVESHKRIAEANVRLRAASVLLAESSRTEERLRISRELHDLVGHQLTVLALELEIASHQATGEAAEPVRRAREVTRGLLADVRSAVGELRHEGPRLRETLEDLVADLPEPAVHLRVDEAIEVDAAAATTLVRCVQEIVTNTIRHAEAENLWIEVDAAGDRVVFASRDDGRGARDFKAGNGLRGMAERLESHGGNVAFSGEDGFRVRAEVPVR
ncbi:histidine kinase [Glycomyces sp. NPDC046736]|uniref:sensor histidine kinase n=1 Tax=Glycomyces sp. NPDC046736 TaxID=3155615 RepID=UPI00340096B7